MSKSWQIDKGVALPISVLIQTKNEAASIGRTIEALKDFDEVIVVDSLSSDDTARIARAAGASVVDFDWNGTYPKKKQWQLFNVPTKHRHIFFLDADEYPSPELIRELRQQNWASESVAAFDVRLTYHFAGKRLKHGHEVIKRCILDRERCFFPDMKDEHIPGMGELEGHYQPSAIGKVRQLRGRLNHEDLDPVRTWFDRHNKYSEWEASLRLDPTRSERIRRQRSTQGRVFAFVPGKPLAFFMYSYFLRLGFLDGQAGFDYSLALAFYYWQIGLKRREALRTSR